MKKQLRSFFSNLLISFQGHGWKQAALAAQRTRWTSPCTGHPSISGCTHTHTHWLRQCRHTSSPHMHIFGFWEKIRVLQENPCSHRENELSPYRQWSWWEWLYFSPQHCNKRAWNKMTIIWGPAVYVFG